MTVDDHLLSKTEELTLIGLASKAALLAENDGVFTNAMERVQFVSAASNVRGILSRLDADWPGLVPVPTDGVAWKNRT